MSSLTLSHAVSFHPASLRTKSKERIKGLGCPRTFFFFFSYAFAQSLDARCSILKTKKRANQACLLVRSSSPSSLWCMTGVVASVPVPPSAPILIFFAPFLGLGLGWVDSDGWSAIASVVSECSRVLFPFFCSFLPPNPSPITKTQRGGRVDSHTFTDTRENPGREGKGRAKGRAKGGEHRGGLLGRNSHIDREDSHLSFFGFGWAGH